MSAFARRELDWVSSLVFGSILDEEVAGRDDVVI